MRVSDSSPLCIAQCTIHDGALGVSPAGEMARSIDDPDSTPLQELHSAGCWSTT